LDKFNAGKTEVINKIHFAFEKFTNEKRDELTNQRVSKDFQLIKNTTLQGNNLVKAPLIDETFMAHSVP